MREVSRRSAEAYGTPYEMGSERKEGEGAEVGSIGTPEAAEGRGVGRGSATGVEVTGSAGEETETGCVRGKKEESVPLNGMSGESVGGGDSKNWTLALGKAVDTTLGAAVRR